MSDTDDLEVNVGEMHLSIEALRKEVDELLPLRKQVDELQRQVQAGALNPASGAGKKRDTRALIAGWATFIALVIVVVAFFAPVVVWVLEHVHDEPAAAGSTDSEPLAYLNYFRHSFLIVPAVVVLVVVLKLADALTTPMETRVQLANAKHPERDPSVAAGTDLGNALAGLLTTFTNLLSRRIK